MKRLTRQRARQVLFARETPAQASRAGERVYRLGLCAQAREEYGLARDYFTLSTALNERRHALIQWGLATLALTNGFDDERHRVAHADHTREAQALLNRIGGGA